MPANTAPMPTSANEPTAVCGWPNSATSREPNAPPSMPPMNSDGAKMPPAPPLRVREDRRDELHQRTSAISTLTASLPESAVAERHVAAAGDALRLEQRHRRDGEHAGDETADRGLRPARQRLRARNHFAQPEQRLGERDRDERGGDAEHRVEQQRRRVSRGRTAARTSKTGCSPSTLRSTTAASAAATMTPESSVWSSVPTISSIVNVTAAIGALNAAAMPAAAPTGISRRTFRCETPASRPRPARDARADLHGRALAAERRAGADLERADEELADRVAERAAGRPSRRTRP